MATKKVTITNTKLSTHKAGPKPFKGMIKDAMNELADVKFSKPATILYKKLPDNMILITGFENFLTADEVKAKFGEEVARIYFNYNDSMVKKFTDTGAVNVQVGKPIFGLPTLSLWLGSSKLANDGSRTISISDIYRKQDFSKLIGRVKKCGSLLHDVIAAVNDGQVKRITI